MKDKILAYLTEKYTPTSILLYGSYANGTNDETSDFDCMLIVPQKKTAHDDSVVGGVQMDCFLFTKEETAAEDLAPFLTVYDASIALDDGTGAALKARVRQYVADHSVRTEEDRIFLRSWIKKTCARIRKGDDEGCFRAVALLSESLEDYCLLRDRFYFGSKKTIQYLKENDPAAYDLFHSAISSRTETSILRWAEYLVREDNI
ncbi:MAG: nucleotidyltransferase domain-containing protein [Faecousia sp.]